MQTLFALLMFISSVFLILLVLVQRGRGGGLSGAFGGMGGQSAFGAKAGDTFTRVTVVSATIWILLCMLATGLLSGGDKDESILTQGGDSIIEEIAGDASDLDASVPPAPADLDADASTETPADVDAAAADASTPAADASTPAADASTPAADASTPAADVSTPAAEGAAGDIPAEVSTEATIPAGE